MQLLSLGGVVGPILFATVVVVAAAIRPDYSHITHFISDLGATGSANSALMNYGGFLPAGAMIAAFGISLAKILPRHRLVFVAAALVTLFGLGVAASGVTSCDPGCPNVGGSTENLIHNTIAPVSFLSLIVGAGILGIRFRTLPAWRGFSTYSLLTSAVGLVCLAALASSLETRTFTGLWQRLLLTVLFLWCAVIGLQAFRYSKAESPNS